jgi:4-methyl-5(b-hydroxyethyl)-thiazole monophosphate biosynthesis
MASVLVPLAEGCEELEAVTIIDLLRRAGIEVVAAGLREGPVKASRGVTLIPDTSLEEALERQYDMVVLPGGKLGAENLNNDLRLREVLKRMNDSGRFIGAICAAPMMLAGMGLLRGRHATSYPGVLDAMNVPGLHFSHDPVVVDGHTITSRGPGTAMDFALCLIEQLAGVEKRKEVEQGLVRSLPG